MIVYKRYENKNFNNNVSVNNGRAIFRFFPGATSSDFTHYIKPTLQDGDVETVVIHAGINDILKFRNTTPDLLIKI